MFKKLFILFLTSSLSFLSYAQYDSTYFLNEDSTQLENITFIEDTTQSALSDTSIVILNNEEPDIPDTKIDIKESELWHKDYNPIYAMLDSLAMQKYLETSTFTVDTNEVNIYGYKPGEIPKFSDSIYKERIQYLNLYSPIEMTYNAQVRSYIDSYTRWTKLTSKMLGLSEIYFPMFEELLDKYDIPLEIKYLAIVESALNPKATSRAGAKGLWQFMYGTGKLYGLKVTSITDDRCDPYKATDAACRHLKDLYNIYNDWSLALAAYNCGSGNVNKAIYRSGGKKNFWLLWPYLPRETRGYVPAFIAVNYIMNYATEHNIYPIQPGIFSYQIDTLAICDVLSFEQISEVIGVPTDMLDFLNPMYKKGIIPASEENQMSLTLPREYIHLFIANEDSIYNYKTKSNIEKEHLLAEIKKVENQAIHTVKSGETLSHIAQKYRCSVSQLKSWNGLKSNNLRIGQKLVVFPVGGGTIVSKTTTSSSTTSDYHIVKKGETLESIAKKYMCSVSDIQKWNNLNSTNISIGQKLAISKKTQATSTEKSTNIKYSTYIVKEGDNLWSIANSFKGVTIEDIKEANGLKNNNLKINQKLKIPSKS